MVYTRTPNNRSKRNVKQNKSQVARSTVNKAARIIKAAAPLRVARKRPARPVRARLSGARTKLPTGVSMVNDGVNTGSVWKNTTAERVTFPVAREKFSDLTSTGTTFQVLEQQFVNPGNSSLFPIFSEIAKVYEEYVPNVLRIYYRTKEYTASGSTVSAGLGAMAVNFDPNDPNFGNMTALENYEHSISGAPFSGIMCLDVLEMHRRRFKGKGRDLALNNYYVNYAANTIGPSTDQAKWYDVGNFQFAVDGTQAGVIGELWIEYSFTMIRRKAPENGSGGFLMAHLRNYANDATAASPMGLTPFTSITAATGSTLSTVNMDTNLARYSASTIGLNDTNDLIFNLPNSNSKWLVNMTWNGATAIAASPSVNVSNGATAQSIWGPAGATAAYPFFLAAGTSAGITFVSSSTLTGVPTATTNQVSVTGLTNMTDGNLDIFVVRIPNDIEMKVDSFFEQRFAALERRLKLLSIHEEKNIDDCELVEVRRPGSSSSSAATTAAASSPAVRAGEERKDAPRERLSKPWF